MKKPVQFSKNIELGLELLTFGKYDPENLSLVGSVVYKNQLYAADVDLREQIDLCCSTKDVGEVILRKLRYKASQIHQLFPDFLFSEFKTGDPPERFGLLEIINMTNNDEAYLTNTIAACKGVTKLDIYVWNGSRYIEMSNFMIVQVLSPTNEVETCEQPDYIQSLVDDMKFYYQQGNIFKSIKRLWTISLATDNKELFSILDSVISSSLGLLYQIISDINTVEEIDNKFNLDRTAAVVVKERIDLMLDQLNDKIPFVVDEPIYVNFENFKNQRQKLKTILNEASEEFLKKENIDILGY